MDEDKKPTDSPDDKELTYIDARAKKYAAETDMDMLLAAELFKSLGDYKDSELMAKLCFDSASKQKKQRHFKESLPRTLLILFIPIAMILVGVWVSWLNR